MAEGSSYPINHTTTPSPAIEFIALDDVTSGSCPEEFRDLVTIDTIHDGNVIPARLFESPRVEPLVASGVLWNHFVRERDWGANLVAEQIARSLGLAGYTRVTTARIVLDFNRFPGSSPPNATPLDRMAIIFPFAQQLDHFEKRFILKTYYDAISEGMEAAILGKLVKISIHTYDAFNPSRTERPEVSLITRALSYQLNSQLPFGLFDPLFPDILVESTCNSILRDRLSITLQKAGISVEHNYPYCAPDGSLEVRTQPWFYFQRVRSLFEREYPETRAQPAYLRVWDMLLNTNLRDGDAEALRGYLHRFRGVPAGRERDFVEAGEAYEVIAAFTHAHPELVGDYRSSPSRPSSLSIEVRKDLIFRFEEGQPVEPIEENIRLIAETAAEGIATFLLHDQAELIARDNSYAPWSITPTAAGDTGL